MSHFDVCEFAVADRLFKFGGGALVAQSFGAIDALNAEVSSDETGDGDQNMNKDSMMWKNRTVPVFPSMPNLNSNSNSKCFVPFLLFKLLIF